MRRHRLLLGMVCASLLCACQGPVAAPAALVSMGHISRQTKAPVSASPTVADLDGDGILEIAIGAQDGYFYLLDDRLNSLPGWPHYDRAGFVGSAALADLDDDGELEVLAASDAGKLYAWNKDGSEVPGWPVALGYRSWSAPTVLADGQIAIPGLEQLLVYAPDGTPAPGWPQAQPDWSTATVAAGPDLLTVTTAVIGTRAGGTLCAWHDDGDSYAWSPLALGADSSSSPSLADLDGDGVPEIVFGDADGAVWAVDLDGATLPGWPQHTDGAIDGSPALADLDGDGTPEIVVGSADGQMHAWSADGTPLPGWPQAAGGAFAASAALVDLDGDGVADILAACRDGNLYGWRNDGVQLSGFPLSLGAPSASSPWVGDLEGDGRVDIVVGADDGLHLLRDVGSLGTAPWPEFHHDAQKTGYIP